MEDLLLVGGGGHCRAVIDVIELEGRWRIAGVVDPGLAGDAEVLGYPVLGADDNLPALRRHVGHALVTIGQIRTAAPRIGIFSKLVELGYGLALVVSPAARVSRHAEIDRGTVVMHASAVGPCARIGANSIVNTRALIEHDACVGAHCHISTGAILNGNVRLGEASFVGSGSVVREGLELAPRSFIPMGIRVTRPLTEPTPSERKDDDARLHGDR